MKISNIAQIIQQTGKSLSKPTNKTEGFGDVISSVLSQTATLKKHSESEKQILLSDTLQIVQAKDLDEVLQVLGINTETEKEEVVIGLLNEDFSAIEKVPFIDEFNLKQIAVLLNIDQKELIQSISTLVKKTGEDSGGLLENLRGLLEVVERKGPEIQRELIQSFNGSGLQPQQAVNVIKFLKVMEIILPNTDMTMEQESLSFSLKDVMAKLETAFLQTEKTATVPELRPMVKVKVVEVKMDAVEGTTLNIERTVSKTETHSVILPANRSSHAEALVKEFQTIMNRSAFGQAGGATKLLIKIYPENLGTVRIELVQKDGVLTARLLSSTALGKELLDSQSQQLRHAFAQQNLTVERLEISQTLQDPARHDKNNSFGQQFKQQQEQGQQQQSEQDQPKESFLDLLMEVEV